MYSLVTYRQVYELDHEVRAVSQFWGFAIAKNVDIKVVVTITRYSPQCSFNNIA